MIIIRPVSIQGFSKHAEILYDYYMITITDEQWKAVEEVLPRQSFKKGGRPRTSDRRTLGGILWVLKNGEQWSHMPAKYGAYVTCWRRYNQWVESGLWTKIWRAYFGRLDHKDKLSWTLAFWEGSVVPMRNSNGK